MKQLFSLIFVVAAVLILYGADADISICIKLREIFIGFIVWAILALIILSVINYFLSMLD